MPELTRSWVASRTSARHAARAFLGWTLRRPRFWIVVGLVWVVLSLLFALTFEGDPSTATRVLWGPVFGLVAAALVVGVLVLAVHLLTVRRMRLRLQEGHVLESGFGDGVVRVRGPLSESLIRAEGIESVRVVGAWVLLRQRGIPVIGLWPAELFPPEEVARLGVARQAP